VDGIKHNRRAKQIAAIALGSSSQSKGSAKEKHIDRAGDTLGSGFSSSSVSHTKLLALRLPQ
jgi:hypothetical protein